MALTSLLIHLYARPEPTKLFLDLEFSIYSPDSDLRSPESDLRFLGGDFDLRSLDLELDLDVDTIV